MARCLCRQFLFLILLSSATFFLKAQSTEAVITGRVTNLRDGSPILSAHVRYRNYETGATGAASTDGQGNYSLPCTPPGIYTIRGEAPEFQAREIQALEIYVSARLELEFTLKPLGEVPVSGGYNNTTLADDDVILPVLGPDLERGRSAPLETTDVQSELRQPSLSYVIDPQQISKAPLSARNVYSLLVTLPGVTASQVTGRGLQLSANGQRPSASNYLLDGVQNNDLVNTGPFSAAAPEAIQEYRVSTSNYSAEYGQTGGFIANAITRRGGQGYHGNVYTYVDNDALGANTFWNNANTGPENLFPRNPFKRTYAGYSATGPILRNRLFFSSALEQLRSRSKRNPNTVAYLLPNRLRECNNGNSNPLIDLYSRFPVRDPSLNNEVFTGQQCQSFGLSVIRKPVSVERSIAFERADYQSPDGRNRLMSRLVLFRASQPDFVYSIYQDLSEALVRNTTGVSVTYVREVTPLLTSDLRLGLNFAHVGAMRPHPDIPILQVSPGIFTDAVPATPVFGGPPQAIFAPRSLEMPSAGSGLEFAAKGGNFEVHEGVTWVHHRHFITGGGGVLLRRPEYLLSYLAQGTYYFGATPGICFGNCPPTPEQNFAHGTSIYYQIPVDRIQAAQGKYVPLSPPGYDRYAQNEFAFYLQDNIKLTSRLALNLGVRYESYGSLLNDSEPQTFLEPGPGQSIVDRLAGASLVSEPRSAYRVDRNNWAGRFGISYNPFGGTVIRAGYGVFYDRP